MTKNTETKLREQVDHILGYGINATVFYDEDFTEALIHLPDSIISVTYDGHTAETQVSYSTGYEL